MNAVSSIFVRLNLTRQKLHFSTRSRGSVQTPKLVLFSKWRIFSPLNNVNILEDSSDFAYPLSFFNNLAILLFSEIILFMINW